MEITQEKALALLAHKEAVDNHISVSERAFELDRRSLLFKLQAEERKNIIDMRRDWSKWILRCILFIVISDVIVMFLLGIHWMSFDSQWMVPVFVADSMTKVLGLAWIIVNFLFGKDSFFSEKKNDV